MPNITSVKATINGSEYVLTLNSTTGKYEATITAPAKSSYTKAGHYYGVSLTAADNAGNSTTINETDPSLGGALKLVVKEKVAPVITIVSPSTGATITTNKPTITVDVTDNDSGVDTSKFTLKVGSATVSGGDCTVTDIANGKRFTYALTTALPDGACSISATASDNDGNAATSATATIKVDTTSPNLNISAPANDVWQNTYSVTVAGTTNDETSAPVTVAITVNGADAGAITVDASGRFSKQVTLTEGVNTIVVKATDAAGKYSTVTRTVNVNTVAPIFKAITLTPNPVDAGATYIISIEIE